jgi:DNA-binding MarR family transcriptional regulator
MTLSSELSDTLHRWSETYMRRSIHDLILFSRESGLSMHQMSVLFHLRHGKDCGVSTIGEHLGVTNAAASQMIDRLVQNGFVERKEDPHDRRVKQLSLTQNGMAIVQEGINRRRRWIDELANELSIEDQYAVTSALKMVLYAADELEANIIIPS